MKSKEINKIPISKISEQSDNGIVLRYISSDKQVVNIDYVHRDNYYIFIFLESGLYKACIDFEEYQLEEQSIAFIQEGQVHFSIEHKNIIGWILAVDTVLISDESKDVFDRNPAHDKVKILNKNEFQHIKWCISILYKKMTEVDRVLKQNLIYSLTSSLVGLLAEKYQNNNLHHYTKRESIITHQFRKLLTNKYRSIKSPSQYSSELNLSLSYLNEVVKETTGFSVSQSIKNQIVLQAKRLLFHSDMTIKEIANELGYDDHAYFTRLFTKAIGMSPTQFKANYRK